jgi:hypothetical protein
MRFIKQFPLIFFLACFTRFSIADEPLRGVSLKSENGATSKELSISPSSLKLDSIDSLKRVSAEKYLTGCAIPPDVNGHVIIPEDWNKISDGAFYNCQTLKSVHIPANVTTIGSEAFRTCYSLTEVTFSSSSTLTTIEYAAFFGTGLLSFAVPALVTTIGNNVFHGCVSLREVTFSPDSSII